MTLWPSTNFSYLLTANTFHQFHDINTEIDPNRVTSGFYGAFALGVTC